MNTEKNCLFDLSSLSILDLDGNQALNFLQGQVSCDVRPVSEHHMAQGAQCNLKGRILALMDIIDWQGPKLVLPQDLLELTQNSLLKTAMLSRVGIHANSGLKLFGFCLNNPADRIPVENFLPVNQFDLVSTADYCYYHLSHGFYIFIIKNEIEAEFCKHFIENDQFLGSLTWHTLRLMNHSIDIYPDSRGLFLPHRLDLQKTKYLAFDKGCYKGQEIIARMHYKATMKHDLKIFSITNNARIYSGQKLKNIDNGTELGELIDYSYLADKEYLIAVSILKEAPQSALFEGCDEVVELRPFRSV